MAQEWNLGPAATTKDIDCTALIPSFLFFSSPYDE